MLPVKLTVVNMYKRRIHLSPDSIPGSSGNVSRGSIGSLRSTVPLFHLDRRDPSLARAHAEDWNVRMRCKDRATLVGTSVASCKRDAIRR
jgi:hypothetical protein